MYHYRGVIDGSDPCEFVYGNECRWVNEMYAGLSYMRFGLMDYTLEQLIEGIDREFGHLKTFRLGYV